MFQQGLSGLDGASQSLDVIGNNIANASTVGFKSSTAEFADVYANSLNSVSGNTAGIGVSVGTIAQNFTQGSIQASANPLDVSINGGGFFRTVAPNGAIEFSRNGQFTVSSPNYVLTNAQGAQLTGAAGDQPVRHSAGRHHHPGAAGEPQLGQVHADRLAIQPERLQQLHLRRLGHAGLRQSRQRPPDARVLRQDGQQ